MLKVKNLSKKISGKMLLNNVSFTLEPGQIAILTGPSGGGKSTLLRVLNGLEKYDSGTFELSSPVDGIGMVFQHFNLFEHLTVEENITLPLRKCKGKSHEEAKLIAHELLLRYELQDKVNIRVHKLSGGQKQRLAIARTLALNPTVICMDEPTSALDPRLTKQVASYICELAAEGKGVLLATHDVGLLEHLNGQHFVMDNGSMTTS